MTSARVLASRLADLLGREHAAMAEFLVALADFDRRGSWLELGYSSLFYFLHRELGLSKGAAHYRKTAAELAQRFPEIVEPLRDGRLCITSIVHLAKVLTAENRHEMLPKFFHCSKREAMAVAAALHPANAAPHRDVVTALRTVSAPLLTEAAAPHQSASQFEAVVQPVEPIVSPSTAADVSASAPTEIAPASSLPKPVRRDSAEPLTDEVSRLHVTVSRRFLEKLEAARDALSHARPGASAEAILEAGLDLVLQRHASRKGLVRKPRHDRPAAKSSGLTATVKRQVWTRDRGRCQWPLESGGVCGSALRVEFDHIVPRAGGGPSTIENIRLLCRVHNDLAARRAFGDDWMNQFTRKPAEHGSAHPAHGTAPP